MDTDIIEKAKRKDPEALAEIYEMYRPRMMRTCMNILKEDKDTANDLVHDAFVLAFVSVDKLRDNERLGEWLTTIVRNVTLKYKAQKGRMRTEPLSAVDDMDSSSTPEAFVDGRDILRLVEQLPEGYAKVFRLSVIEGFTHKEIADMLGIEPHSSSSQLSRAKRLLRRMMLAVVLLLAGLAPLCFFLFQHDEQEVCKVSKTKKRPQPRQSDGADAKPYSHTADSGIAERKDTVVNIPIIEEERLTVEVAKDSVRTIFKDTIMLQKERHLVNDDKPKRQKWPFLAAGSFGPALAQGVYKAFFGEDITSTEGETVEEQHDRPITFSLSLTKPLNERWSIETGLQYSLLNSRFTQGSTVSRQQVHYLGLPLKLSYRMVDYRRLSVYQSTGVTLHLPVYGKTEANGTAQSVSPSWQWAVNAGLGLQYQLAPNVNLFVEPTVNWFIPSGSDTHTIWTEQPVMVTTPFGIRFTW